MSATQQLESRAENCSFCSICCESKIPSNMCTLVNCSHESCKGCIVKWIHTEESAGQSQSTCPFCRMKLPEEETSLLLGRPFESFAVKENVGHDEEIDEFTLSWLEQNTKSCPRCRAYIQKAFDYDCDLMECLCGNRFCFHCGSQGGRCDCVPQYHGFWDNVLDCCTDRSDSPYLAFRDEAGCIQFKDHILHRTQVWQYYGPVLEELKWEIQRREEERMEEEELLACIQFIKEFSIPSY
mmetsp:Transcript_8142/g.11842  ORF Transcript_8142/g.11842 Transcript_8142/m.11842 type:complete len:239 (-) Transcript_8142:1634-2350(-)